MTTKEMAFFMEFFPLFRKLSKEKQTAIGLVTDGARIAAGAVSN